MEYVKNSSNKRQVFYSFYLIEFTDLCYFCEQYIDLECEEREEEHKIEIPLDQYEEIKRYLVDKYGEELVSQKLVCGRFNTEQVCRIAELDKISLLSLHRGEESGVVLLDCEIGISSLILFCCLMWNEEFQKELDESIHCEEAMNEEERKEKVLKKGIQSMKRSKSFSVDKQKLATSAFANTIPKGIVYLTCTSVAGSSSSSTIVAAPIVGSILSSVDVYRFCRGYISKEQMFKNVGVISAGVGGSAGLGPVDLLLKFFLNYFIIILF